MSKDILTPELKRFVEARKLQHVIDLLNGVIENKQQLLKAIQEVAQNNKNTDKQLVYNVTVNFLEINLTELQNVREHLLEVDDIG